MHDMRHLLCLCRLHGTLTTVLLRTPYRLKNNTSCHNTHEKEAIMNTSKATYRADLSDTKATYDEHGTGTVCGPEYYAGGEWSMRHIFEHDDGTYTVVTEYAAVIDGADLHNRDDRDRPYTVEESTEFVHCTDWDDVGGTEIDSDTQHGEGSMFAYATTAEAEDEARTFGARMSHEYFDFS